MQTGTSGASRARTVLLFLGPLAALALMVALFLVNGDRLTAPIRTGMEGLPVPESITFDRIVFKKSQIVAYVMNSGPTDITISGVHVNDMATLAYLSPSNQIPRLGRAVVTIPFDWVQGDPYEIRLVSSAGLFHSKTVEVASLTPTPGRAYYAIFSLLGLYVGVIPVFLGLAWFPLLRRAGPGWLSFFLAFTVGLLVFLGVDALDEAMELRSSVAGPLQPTMLILIATLATFMLISAVGNALTNLEARKGRGATGAVLAMMIAFGIGVHNFGEGLAIGAAYSLGRVTLGSLLVLGFMIHNTTEGIAIVAPLARAGAGLGRLVTLGAIAGVPTIFGAWVGGFAYSPMWSLVFLGVGAGAVFQVAYVIAKAEEGGAAAMVTRFRTVAGLLAGLLVMYVTGLLVA